MNFLANKQCTKQKLQVENRSTKGQNMRPITMNYMGSSSSSSHFRIPLLLWKSLLFLLALTSVKTVDSLNLSESKWSPFQKRKMFCVLKVSPCNKISYLTFVLLKFNPTKDHPILSENPGKNIIDHARNTEVYIQPLVDFVKVWHIGVIQNKTLAEYQSILDFVKNERGKITKTGLLKDLSSLEELLIEKKAVAGVPRILSTTSAIVKSYKEGDKQSFMLYGRKSFGDKEESFLLQRLEVKVHWINFSEVQNAPRDESGFYTASSGSFSSTETSIDPQIAQMLTEFKLEVEKDSEIVASTEDSDNIEELLEILGRLY